jgi:hypothetical protein
MLGLRRPQMTVDLTAFEEKNASILLSQSVNHTAPISPQESEIKCVPARCQNADVKISASAREVITNSKTGTKL